MFWKSKEAKEKEKFERAFSQIREAAPKIADSWSYFCNTLVFKPEVTLFDRVKAFSFPNSEWARNNYPDLAHFPFTYFSAVILGVWLSGTTSKAEVEKLADECEAVLSIPRLGEGIKFWTNKSD